MDLLNNLALGFGVAFTWINLAYAFGGAVLGTLIGVLPGLGPVATIAMLLPSIYALDATPGADHAGRHLLRRAVRRVDHGHPDQRAG
jgi:TctA family transporter